MQQVRWHFAWLPSRRERIVLVRSQNHSSALCFWEASPLQPRLSPLTRRQILACPRKDKPCCSLLGRKNTFSFLGESERRVDDQRICKIFIFNCLFLIFKPSAASPWVMVATSWISPSCSMDTYYFDSGFFLVIGNQFYFLPVTLWKYGLFVIRIVTYSLWAIRLMFEG